MMRILRRFSQDKSLYVADFHEQPFAERLNRILIKSAGSFKCRDDRDRLDAVLGIAGGATAAPSNSPCQEDLSCPSHLSWKSHGS